MINDSGPVTSCISSFIFSVRNTTLSTTRVIFPYTAEIQNVLVYAYKIYRAIHCFSDSFGVVYEADQSTTPTKFYNEYTTPVIFPIYSYCTGVLILSAASLSKKSEQALVYSSIYCKYYSTQYCVTFSTPVRQRLSWVRHCIVL
jgi:hypothetical protein